MPAPPVRPAVSAGLLTSFVFLFVGAALATAAPAAAIDDPTRPDARVTHGPSCRPGGLVVEVMAGTAPYAVRLATTQPAGEDEAVLQPGERVILRSADVGYGETIDGRLEYSARDGSGTTFVDELDEYSFTRPTQEDCDAVAAPTTPEPESPTASPAPTGGADGGADAGQTPTPGTPDPVPEPTEGTSSAAPVPAGTSDEPRQVSAGGTVTVQAGGFLPGERVTIRLHDGDVLGAVTAGPDGTVEAEIRIPDGTAAGRTTVDLVGTDSAVIADVPLRVAGAESALPAGRGELLPLTAAAVALVGTVAGLVSVAGAQRAAGRRHAGIRSA